MNQWVNIAALYGNISLKENTFRFCNVFVMCKIRPLDSKLGNFKVLYFYCK